MTDIAPKLIERIKTRFTQEIDDNRKLQSIFGRIRTGLPTQADLLELATVCGELLGQCFRQVVTPDVLPNGRMYFNIADRVLRETLGIDFEFVSDAAVQILTGVNVQNGTVLSAVAPKINEDRIKGLVDHVSTAEKYEDISASLPDQITNFSQSVADDAIRENADFQYNAGLSPKVVRTAEAKACKWCRSVAGSVPYEDTYTGHDIWRRHVNCNCLIEFVSGKHRDTVDNYRRPPDASKQKIAYRKAITAPDDRKGVRS